MERGTKRILPLRCIAILPVPPGKQKVKYLPCKVPFHWIMKAIQTKLTAPELKTSGFLCLVPWNWCHGIGKCKLFVPPTIWGIYMTYLCLCVKMFYLSLRPNLFLQPFLLARFSHPPQLIIFAKLIGIHLSLRLPSLNQIRMKQAKGMTQVYGPCDYYCYSSSQVGPERHLPPFEGWCLPRLGKKLPSLIA